MPLLLGTRGSALALTQTHWVKQALLTLVSQLTRVSQDPESLFYPLDPDRLSDLSTFLDSPFSIEERLIQTTGDQYLDHPLDSSNRLHKGLFTQALEQALLDHEVDAVVHSLKDLPTERQANLHIGAICPRASFHDLLISKHPASLGGLPLHATVATSSPRRQRFLLWKRPDLNLIPIRGNVPTRIQKLANHPEIDALVLATAGIERLGLQALGLHPLNPSSPPEASHSPSGLSHSPSRTTLFSSIPPIVTPSSYTLLESPFQDPIHLSTLNFMLPAPGQGAIAIECRVSNHPLLTLLQKLNDTDTARSVYAEREILRALGGGCALPLGVLGQVIGQGIGEQLKKGEEKFTLQAAWFREEMQEPRQACAEVPLSDWLQAIPQVAKQLQG